MVRGLVALLRRDLRLALRQGADAVLVAAFFVLAVLLFPFGVGPEPAVLARIGPGVLWVMALFASLLAADRLFLADYEDGGLDLLSLAPPPLALVVLAKVAAHWLATGVPLLLAAPLLALMLGLEAGHLPALAAALALGTPVLSLLAAMGAALTLGARRSGVLMPLIVLPLYVPVLVFGVGAIETAIAGLSPHPHLMILGAFLLAALALAPVAAAAALRQALQ